MSIKRACKYLPISKSVSDLERLKILLSGIFSILIIFSLLPLASALAITLKPEYKQGETLIAELQGTFLSPLTADDVYFYSGRTFIPMVYDIGKFSNKYYIYAVLPFKQRNYTLVIKNPHYFEKGVEKFEDIKADFSVSSETADFSVSPGLVITSTDFFIDVSSNSDILQINSEFQNLSSTAQARHGVTERIYFSILNKSEETFALIKSANTEYQVPVSVSIPITQQQNQTQNQTQSQNQTQVQNQTSNQTQQNQSYQNQTQSQNQTQIINITREKFRFVSKNLSIKVFEGISHKFELSLSNTGKYDAKNIRFNASEFPAITISPDSLNLKTGEIKKINVTINSKDIGELNKNIYAYTQNYTAILSISLKTIEYEKDKEKDIGATISLGGNKTITLKQDERTCSDMKGKVCQEDTICSAEIWYTVSGEICCLGECNQKPSGSKTIVIISLIIIGIIVLIFAIAKIKSRNKKNPVKDSMESYEERFKPREIRGGLTRE